MQQQHTVEIDWIGRRVADLPSRTRRRFGRKKKRRDDRDGSWLDALDLPFPDDLWIAIAVLVALLLGWLLWEVFVGAVVLFLLELVVLIPLAIPVLVWRTLLRRPWRVVVLDEHGEEVRHVDVVGWLAARRLRDDLRSQLRAGAVPVDLYLDRHG